ncbi:bifunctional tetrahydrofolate synthase/dihydrofolate synthase [Pelistega sp. MC2]|uniref:bifunctional tetrahydrofolate synthase/dihydrofolate synthase n=1 Tax=Pelistega sp. MC2 TaxID=1720297 RepID=UPI0008DB04AB|nr:bifunctional tetrahydrofolate synthase/dihydrofolate synthase [Pelistega sp. MC2]
MSVPTLHSSLQEWLTYLETLHPKTIDLGLERIRPVADKLGLNQWHGKKIIVAGTNGKGSTCAMLEAIYLSAGYKAGMYTSPHLIKFNERIRINGEYASDEAIIAKFAEIEVARGDITLSYFEYTTLAAFLLFKEAELDISILEVGLGGRLDVVNLIDADCAIVTSVDIDHTEYLGNTREAIGWEKAHVFRTGKPAICSDPEPPESLLNYAKEIGADLWLFGRDFNYDGDKQQWAFAGRGGRKSALAYPALRGANQLLNASAALAAIEALKPHLAVPIQAIREGLLLVTWPGRFQILPGQPTTILDVAHNPHAAAVLAHNLYSMSYFPYTYAVLGMLKDKDAVEVIQKFKGIVDYWYVTDLPGPRGRKGQELADIINTNLPKDSQGLPTVEVCASPEEAYQKVKEKAKNNDRIVVFGSFLTVSAVLDYINQTNNSSL